MSLTEKVYRQLKDQILRTQKVPGLVIFEADLADEFGVSRTPVREALSLLASRGWVVVLPRKGYLIRPVELRDIGEIFTVRRMIEPSLAEQAARVGRPEHIVRLREHIEEQASGVRLADALEAARSFHVLLAELTGSDRLVAMLTDLTEEVQRLHYLLPQIESHITSDQELRAHREIVDAIAAGEPELARTRMLEHLQEVSKELVIGFSGA